MEKTTKHAGDLPRQTLRSVYEQLNSARPDYVPLSEFERHDLDCLFSCGQRQQVWGEQVALDGATDDVGKVIRMLRESPDPVFAMIAPAFISQFSDQVTPGKLRSACKRLGFSGMVEVSLFADILTLREAYEFDRHVQTDRDFMLTSCCCPLWIALVRKSYSQLIPRIPPSVSPMVACGRAIRQICPGAKTVFIGPCIAKKAEAREADVRDAVDHVLTFAEVQTMLAALQIEPVDCEDDLRDHSAAAGRIYARVGGVSQAVQETVDRIHPDRVIPLRAVQADGMRECKSLLAEVLAGELTANFLEGMGCVGGCVGGPKRLIATEAGAEAVLHYGRKARYQTPIDNPYVIELLHHLGFDTIGSLLSDDSIFTRRF